MATMSLGILFLPLRRLAAVWNSGHVERQGAVAGHDVARVREGGGAGWCGIPPRVLQDHHTAGCNERRRRLERADDDVRSIRRVEENQFERPWLQPSRRVRKPSADNSIAVADGAVLEVPF